MVTSTDREPCPDRILDDIGGAFGMGALGGSVAHFVNGMRNSPRGERFVGGSQAVRMNAAKTAGGFAVWGGLFSTFDCSMVYMRQKEDPWNSIIAGAATGGLLQMRQGLRASGRSALIGGVFLALFEGAAIMLNKAVSGPQGEPVSVDPQGEPVFVDDLPGGARQGEPVFFDDLPGGPPQEEAAASSSSWFGGLFGGRKEEEKKSGGGVKTEILESFDSPIPPTFEFK